MIDNVVVCCGYRGEKIFARSLFQRRFRIMIEKVYEMDDFEEEEAFREEVYDLANDYGIDIEGLEEL